MLGGVVGAVAGRELADDESDGRRNTATVVGAAAGAVAGNAIENRMIAETRRTPYSPSIRSSTRSNSVSRSAASR